MFLNTLVVLLGLCYHTVVPQGDIIDDIWGSLTSKPSMDEDDTMDRIQGEMTTTLAPYPSSTPEPEECECVPYYICAALSPKNSNDLGEGLLDIRVSQRKRVECPHYLLKCCDDEDTAEIAPPTPEPTPQPIPDPTPEPPPEPRKPKGCGYRNPEARPTQGDGPAGFGEFPWVVAIYLSSTANQVNYICGGTLIHPKVVVSAAHCFKDVTQKPKIRAGEWDSQNENEKYPHQDRDVSSVTIHARYSGPNSFYNDIALLFLKEPVDLAPHVNVVCLPPQDLVVNMGTCISTGWGKESFGKGVLTKLELPMVPRRQCEEDLKRTRLGRYFMLHRSFVCAGGEAGKDTCEGDGGSPLVCPIQGQEDRFFQVGIVSWGVGCGGYRIPGVYVNVPLFRSWINEKLRRKGIDMSGYQA